MAKEAKEAAEAEGVGPASPMVVLQLIVCQTDLNRVSCPLKQ